MHRLALLMHFSICRSGKLCAARLRNHRLALDVSVGRYESTAQMFSYLLSCFPRLKAFQCICRFTLGQG
jgi:hypothetical protein